MAGPSKEEMELFASALEYPTPAERAAFLDGACDGDSELRGRVDGLLKAHIQAGDFLERGFGASEPGTRSRAAGEASGATTDDPRIHEGPGSHIGRYKIVERIGEGGFGTVFRAEQEEPIRRQVALKIIKLGMDTRAVVARFEAERQTLAMMDHPNIARVFDAGATTSGRPYFVMELVQGVPITAYCDGKQLTTRERLSLFVTVCHAVQHAHQKGIIHRDLKPSNILVTDSDDGPVPKIIDFGIAKATDVELSARTIVTRFQQFVGTPAYMSPEQTGVGAPDIDTRSDVYSLGVLLYELLTGRTPFDTKTLLEAGVAEIQRVIRESEPPLPSLRFLTLTQDEQTTAAHRRRVEATRLASELRGDLDRVVIKCLQKERGRRYTTANELAADVDRHLRDQPVLARPDTWSYRAGKFIRRHRVGVGFASVLAVALAGGLAGTITQARRAARHATVAEAQSARADAATHTALEERDFALRQLSRAEAINELNAFLISDAAPSGKPFTARELLARAEHVVDRQKADTVENRVEMLVAIGRLYSTLDEDSRASPVLMRAYEMSRPIGDPGLRAKAACAYAAVIARSGEIDRAEEMYRTAIAELPEEPTFVYHRIFCLLRGCSIARNGSHVDVALQRALEARRLLPASGNPSAALALTIEIDVAECYRRSGRNREASEAFAKVWSQLADFGRDDTEQAGTVLNNWALAESYLGHPLQAEKMFRQAVAIGSANESGSGVSPMLLSNLGWTLVALGRVSEARDYADRSLAQARASQDGTVIDQALLLQVEIALRGGDADAAARTIDELQTRWQGKLPPEHLHFAALEDLRSRVALLKGDIAGAVAASDHDLRMLEAGSESTNYMPAFLMSRTELDLERKEFDSAADNARRMISLLESDIGPGEVSARIGVAHLLLARALEGQGRSDEARRAYETALKHLEPTTGPDGPRTLQAKRGAGQ